MPATKLFVIGCPRSGTTWVQLLLSQHPQVATAPETQIFAYYLDHFQRQWAHEHEGPGRAYQGQAGLSRLLTDDEFRELCRVSAELVLEKIAQRNPHARVVVEKSPKHALHAEFIRRVIPGAKFLHVIRDPRDTIASLMAASRSWGIGWAPRNAIDAARMWTNHVTSARRVSGDPACYREVRYECLRANPVEELRDLLDWLGIAEDRASCARMVAACELDQLQRNANGAHLPLPGEHSPRGFFRKGMVGSGKDELSRTDLRIVEHLCDEVMRGTGYEPVYHAAGSRPARIVAHDVIQRVRESIDWQLQRLLYVV